MNWPCMMFINGDFFSIFYLFCSCSKNIRKKDRLLDNLPLCLKNFADSTIKLNTSSVFCQSECPKTTNFSVSFIFCICSHFSFKNCSRVNQNHLTTSHFQNRCSVLSFSIEQKVHLSVKLRLIFLKHYACGYNSVSNH